MRVGKYQLRACPFCGSEKAVVRTDNEYPELYQVECDVCGAIGPATWLSQETAISLWNDRKQE
jgi:Lar family restriction alleviation protein